MDKVSFDLKIGNWQTIFVSAGVGQILPAQVRSLPVPTFTLHFYSSLSPSFFPPGTSLKAEAHLKYLSEAEQMLEIKHSKWLLVLLVSRLAELPQPHV